MLHPFVLLTLALTLAIAGIAAMAASACGNDNAAPQTSADSSASQDDGGDDNDDEGEGDGEANGENENDDAGGENDDGGDGEDGDDDNDEADGETFEMPDLDAMSEEERRAYFGEQLEPIRAFRPRIQQIDRQRDLPAFEQALLELKVACRTFLDRFAEVATEAEMGDPMMRYLEACQITLDWEPVVEITELVVRRELGGDLEPMVAQRGALALVELGRGDDELFETFVTRLAEGEAELLRGRAATAPGKTAPDFELPDLSDAETTRSLSATEGAWTVLLFWASRMQHTVDFQVNLLKPLWEEYGDRETADGQRLEVLGVAIDVWGETAEPAQDVVEDNGLVWPHAYDRDGDVATQFGAGPNDMPFMVFIGPDGVVRYAGLSYLWIGKVGDDLAAAFDNSDGEPGESDAGESDSDDAEDGSESAGEEGTQPPDGEDGDGDSDGNGADADDDDSREE